VRFYVLAHSSQWRDRSILRQALPPVQASHTSASFLAATKAATTSGVMVCTLRRAWPRLTGMLILLIKTKVADQARSESPIVPRNRRSALHEALDEAFGARNWR
jgi:hypothetical protein